MNEKGALFTEVEPRLATREELRRVHTLGYVNQVLNSFESSEWSGRREDLAILASTFVGGTLVALDALLNKGARTAIHFPGAKHHAQYNRSSGFCVFNDFAIAAEIASRDYGLTVAILDIDAHHGDGTENLMASNPNVLTFSIHEKGIFPGTGNTSNRRRKIYNVPVVDRETGWDPGKGDRALGEGVSDFLSVIFRFKPDLIFIACGADGHAEDPLSNLRYSVEQFVSIADCLRSCNPDIPMLLGGAGGYLPDTRTPEVWSQFASTLATTRPYIEEFPRR